MIIPNFLKIFLWESVNNNEVFEILFSRNFLEKYGYKRQMKIFANLFYTQFARIYFKNMSQISLIKIKNRFLEKKIVKSLKFSAKKC